MKRRHLLLASIICWTIAILIIAYLLNGCATSPAYRAAYNAEFQVRRLAIPVLYSDRWSHIEHVEAGKPFRANCETYSRTIADVLVKDGADPAEIWLLIGRIKGTQVKHMVVYYDGIIIDGRKPYVSAFDVVPHEWTLMCRFDKKGWYPFDRAELGGGI